MLSAEHLGHAAALACAATWAVSTVLFGTAARTVDARALNLLKCALAAVLLGVTAFVVGDVPHPSTRDAIALSVSALLGIVVADTAYFVALQELGAARGVLFVSLVPVCTSLVAWPVLGEALSLRMLLGMIATLAGVTLVVRGPASMRSSNAPSSSSASSTSLSSTSMSSTSMSSTSLHAGRPRRTGVGVIAGAIYCSAQACANVLTKSADASLSPLALSSFRLAVGAAVLGTILAMTKKGRSDVVALAPVLPRGALATFVGAYVGLWLGTYALRTVSAGVATTLVATTPLFAMAFARVVAKEPVTARMLGGAVLAIAGVALLVL